MASDALSFEWSPGAPHPASAAVELQHVTVSYGGRGGDRPTVAVDDLSLAVGAGEICVVVGPSGCGKTTTLRLVNRLVEATSGRVLIDGEDVGRLDPILLRRRIGYVIQQIGLFPHQTVAENIGAVPRLLGWPPERIRRRVDELLEMVGLEPDRMRDRYPAALSGGERQRVGVARALAAEPPLLLMDEPFGAVDPIIRERLQDEFLALQRALGTTVLFVTHDVDEAIKLATRVAVMREGGRLAQAGTPAELLTQPADDYVARFLGPDRALKRLTLIPAGELPLEPMLRAAAFRDELPRVSANATAREVLAAALSSAARAAVIVDDAGRPQGVATLAAIASALAEEPAGRAAALRRGA
jgi:osmoprotectant transport system ATP-binding protein